jgi:preprotein translocase subunit SecG
MKISFPKYGPGELLTRKHGATRIISFVAIVFFAGVFGSYFLSNKLWLLTIAMLGIACILLCLGVIVAIFLNQSEVNETPSALFEENVPRITTQWDYQPRKARRAHAALDSPSAEMSDGLS